MHLYFTLPISIHSTHSFSHQNMHHSHFVEWIQVLQRSSECVGNAFLYGFTIDFIVWYSPRISTLSPWSKYIVQHGLLIPICSGLDHSILLQLQKLFFSSSISSLNNHCIPNLPVFLYFQLSSLTKPRPRIGEIRYAEGGEGIGVKC